MDNADEICRTIDAEILEAIMAKLTSKERKAAPHAGPGDSYPIPDKLHAQKAMQMAKHAGAGAPAIRRKVHAAYPDVNTSKPMAKGGPVRRGGKRGS